MYLTVPIALFGWIPVILVLFATMPARRAVLVAYCAGWMFLPVASFKIEGVPEYSKITATNFGVFLGVLLFDSGALARFRPRWIDLAMVVWCLCSFVSSMHNGLGAYDGMSAVSTKILFWGLPYLIGRVYLTDLAALREAAVALFVSGLVYAPLCWYEMKYSPVLHWRVYGYMVTEFGQSIRYGGFRPTVFMLHGLMLAFWMAAAALSGLWLWQTRSLRTLWGVPTGWLVAVLVVTTVMCRSTNAIILMALGFGVLYGARWVRTRVVLVMVIAVVPAYLVLRITGTLDRRTVHNLASGWIAPDRVASLDFRLENEDLLLAKEMREPVVGWGGWNRYRIVTDEGDTKGITDGMWVIALGENGLVGLVALTTAFLAPALLFMGRMRPRDWSHPLAVGAVVWAVVCTLHMVDCLPNAEFNPVWLVGLGGVAGLRRKWIDEELEEWDWAEMGIGGELPAGVGTYGEVAMLPEYGLAGAGTVEQ